MATREHVNQRGTITDRNPPTHRPAAEGRPHRQPPLLRTQLERHIQRRRVRLRVMGRADHGELLSRVSRSRGTQHTADPSCAYIGSQMPRAIRAQLERVDGTRRDESLRPVSCCAACSAWLTRPRPGRPAGWKRCTGARHGARREAERVAVVDARPSARRQPELAGAIAGASMRRSRGANQLERFVRGACCDAVVYLDARQQKGTSA